MLCGRSSERLYATDRSLQRHMELAHGRAMCSVCLKVGFRAPCRAVDICQGMFRRPQSPKLLKTICWRVARGLGSCLSASTCGAGCLLVKLLSSWLSLHIFL